MKALRRNSRIGLLVPNEAGRGMRNGRDGVCNPVANVLCEVTASDMAQNVFARSKAPASMPLS